MYRHVHVVSSVAAFAWCLRTVNRSLLEPAHVWTTYRCYYWGRVESDLGDYHYAAKFCNASTLWFVSWTAAQLVHNFFLPRK